MMHIFREHKGHIVVPSNCFLKFFFSLFLSLYWYWSHTFWTLFQAWKSVILLDSLNNYHQLLIKEMRETMMYILDLISTLTQGSEVIRWVKTPNGCWRQAHIHMPTHAHTLVFWRRLHLDFHPSSTLSSISIWCDIFIFHHAVLVLQSRHSFQLFPAFFLSSAGVKQNYLLKEEDRKHTLDTTINNNNIRELLCV